MINGQNSNERGIFNSNTTNKLQTIEFIPGLHSFSKATPTVSIALNDTNGTTSSASEVSVDELKGNSISLISSQNWLNNSVRSYTSLRNIRASLNGSLSFGLPNETYNKDNGDVVPSEHVLSSHTLENDNAFYQETLTDLLSESLYSYTPSLYGTGGCNRPVVSNELPNIFNKYEKPSLVNKQRLSNSDKNFFIISNAGKPIFIMHGDDKKVIPLAGIINTIVNYFQVNQQAEIKTMYLRNIGQRFVFLKRGPIIIMVYSKLGESFRVLREQCNFLYSYLISTLTSKNLEKLFRNRSNFDLGTFLAKSDMENLNLICHLLSNKFYPDIFLNALQSNPLEKNIRAKIHNKILQQLHDDSEIIPRGTLLYGFFLTGEDIKMTAVIRPQGHTLYTHDMQLLFCLIRRHLNLNTTDRELWIPICFPKFNSTGFLYSYIKILSLKSKSVMVFLSAQKDAFFKLKLFGDRLLLRLTKEPRIAEIITSNTPCTGFSIRDIPAPLIHHFIYKSTRNAQYIMPSMEYNEKYHYIIENVVPFTNENENNQNHLDDQQNDNNTFTKNDIREQYYQMKLQRYYTELHNSVMSEDGYKSQSKSIINFIQWEGARINNNAYGNDDVVDDDLRTIRIGTIHIMGMAWFTPQFELYIISNNGVSDKSAISSSARKILRWCKKNEQRLFIQSGAIF